MSAGTSAEPHFPPAAYDRLEELMVSDPDAIGLLIYLVTGDDRGPAGAGAALVAKGEREVAQGRGLNTLATMRASADPA